MADARNYESRVARLEACFGRLDEQIKAIIENRRDWKVEIERRLNENNENARKLMEERAKDRAELMPIEVYNSRHAELRSIIESNVREITSRMMEHDRDDIRKHESDGARMKLLEEYKATLNDAPMQLRALDQFKNNIQGRMVVIGGLTGIITGMVAALVVHLLTK